MSYMYQSTTSMVSSSNSSGRPIIKRKLQMFSSDGTELHHRDTIQNGQPRSSHTSLRQGPYHVKLNLQSSTQKLTSQEVKHYLSDFTSHDPTPGHHEMSIGPYRATMDVESNQETSTQRKQHRKNIRQMIFDIIGKNTVSDMLSIQNQKHCLP